MDAHSLPTSSGKGVAIYVILHYASVQLWSLVTSPARLEGSIGLPWDLSVSVNFGVLATTNALLLHIMYFLLNNIPQ